MSDQIKTYTCAAAVKRFAYVYLSTAADNEITECADSSTNQPIGVAQSAGAIGEEIAVLKHGATYAIASADLTNSGQLATAAAGKVVDHAAGVGDFVVGFVNENTDKTFADGDYAYIFCDIQGPLTT